MNINKCHQLNHLIEDIVSVCLNIECKYGRLCCFKCEVELHKDHFCQLVDFYLMSYFLEIQRNRLENYLQFYSEEEQQVINELQALINSRQMLPEEKGIDLIQKINKCMQGYKVNDKILLNGSCYQYDFVEAINNFFMEERFSNLSKFDNAINQLDINKKRIKVLQITVKHIITSIFKADDQINQKFNFIEITELQNIEILLASQDGNMIVSLAQNGTIQLWNFQSKYTGTIKINGQVYSLTLSSNKSFLAIEHTQYLQRSVSIYDLKTNRYHWNFLILVCQKKNVIFSDDCQFLISGGRNLKIWSLVSRKQIFTLNSVTTSNYIITSDNKLISLVNFRCKFSIWNLQNRNEILPKQDIDTLEMCMCFTKDSSRLISSGIENNIQIWKLNDSNINEHRVLTLILIQQIVIELQDTQIVKLILTPNEQYIISVLSNAKILIHDIETGSLQSMIRFIEPQFYALNHSHQLPLIQISRDMDKLVTFTPSNIKFWFKT